MTLLLHEIKRNRLSLIIWSMAISFMLGICILIYPEMKSEMQEVTDIFANMGSFTDAFGMNQVSFGEFKGYFAVECGNVLGLGGAIFAAILGVTALSKEERDRTAELLLTHPISRVRVVTEKLIAACVQVVILNLAVAIITVLCILIVGEKISAYTMFILLLAYLLLQIEITCVTFGISSLLSGGGIGIGLGASIGLYFLNIVANLTKELKFIKYITPFGFADGSDIVARNALRVEYLAVGAIITAAFIILSYFHYSKKDIAG